MAVELFAMELAKGAVGGVGSWIANKALDVIFTCNESLCKTPCNCRINNVDFNDLLCRNCNKHIRQFTNVCSFTIRETGRIAHVATEFGDWQWKKTGLLGLSRTEDLIVPTEYLFIGMKGIQVAEFVELRNHVTGEVHSQRSWTCRPDSDHWQFSGRIEGNASSVDYNGKDVMTHLELKLESKNRDLLLKDRYLIRL